MNIHKYQVKKIGKFAELWIYDNITQMIPPVALK